jgi:hypothetical protein
VKLSAAGPNSGELQKYCDFITGTTFTGGRDLLLFGKACALRGRDLRQRYDDPKAFDIDRSLF